MLFVCESSVIDVSVFQLQHNISMILMKVGQLIRLGLNAILEFFLYA